MKLRIDPVGIIILCVWLWMGNQYIQQESEVDWLYQRGYSFTKETLRTP